MHLTGTRHTKYGLN